MQAAVLQAIVDSAIDTEFGQRHRLRSIDSVASFRDRIPPSTRAESRFDLDRTASGAEDVLLAGRAIAARTTIRGRDPRDGIVVPVTPRCRGRGMRDAAAAWIATAAGIDPEVLTGGVLIMPAPALPRLARLRARSEAPVGGVRPRETPVTGRRSHLQDVLPASVLRRAVFPMMIDEALADLADEDVRRLTMRFGYASDVHLLIGGDADEIAACFAAADAASDDIIRDVRDGTVSVAEELPASLRAQLETGLQADRDRARALERARDGRHGRLLPIDAWELRVVGALVAGDASAASDDVLGPWLDPRETGGGPTVLDLGWMTAEVAATGPAEIAGTAAVPPAETQSITGGGLPLAATAFHEYVDCEALAADPGLPDRWTWHGLHDLESGRRYARFVTTFGGLWRMETRDAVLVRGRVGGGPMLWPDGIAPGMFDLDG